MTHPRLRPRRAAAVAFAATGLIATPAAIAAAATGVNHTTHTTRVTNHSQGLPVQSNNGYDAACGPAADVQAMSMALGLVGIGNVALYTGPGRTGSGCDVISGNGLPIGTDFQVMGMTAANVDNRSDEPVAVYSDTTDNLDAVVPAGADSDISPVDVNFAFYPEGSTPPPDDRGLVPAAVFQFKLVKA
ncbi:hypothetical protein ABH935_001906 [Catenulispora sp. GAS73]|uniref:hypothetical protein n=1 Tax=Catenulispora sp. GAS73 TaxID=3156269 RepID=UPI003517D084